MCSLQHRQAELGLFADQRSHSVFHKLSVGAHALALNPYFDVDRVDIALLDGGYLLPERAGLDLRHPVLGLIQQEDMVGVEYDTCCWTVRMLQLRYYNNVSGQIPDFSNPDLERETTVQFQILLKGMGGFGNRITNIMQNMIRGYEDRGY